MFIDEWFIAFYRKLPLGYHNEANFWFRLRASAGKFPITGQFARTPSLDTTVRRHAPKKSFTIMPRPILRAPQAADHA